MILSFAWTTRALLERRKTVTRRRWTPAYAEKFAPGMLVDAYDRNPRFGGVKVAVIRILSIRREPLEAITADDVVREGFEDGDVQAFLDCWFEHYPPPPSAGRVNPEAEPGDLCYRLEFELVEICPSAVSSGRPNRDGPLFAIGPELAEGAEGAGGFDGRTTK